ncbi:MAG TPA: hypothetical protein VG389_19980 [Myxococcota bacterium]|nr:hypothetical protein [Myxococcota bacterium]
MQLASRGLRDMDGGAEAITDGAELAALRRQARTVHLQSFALAAALTALALLAPPWR